MKIQIDQSGRLEQLNTATVIAGSNSESKAIVITAGKKQQLIPFLRKTLIPAHDLYQVLFSMFIFLLLQEFKQHITRVEIDEEYTGKDKVISETLQKLYDFKRKAPPQFEFTRIGKHANAHHVALATHRSKTFKNARRISKDEIFRLLQPKSRS